MSRRLRACVAGCVLLLLAAGAAPARPLVEAVDSVALTVSDADRTARFFTDVLDFRRVSDTELTGDAWEHLRGVFPLRMRIVRLALGAEAIDLVEYLAPRGRPAPVDSRANDRWFQHVAVVVSDMDRAYARLRAHRVEHASSGPQRLPDSNPGAGGIEAFYFRDPDGHALELIRFPAGKGDPRWQRRDALFLGIDHTAIVVADTERSLGFYRDVLGLRVAGESENHGTEQEHLNGVFGARLRITGLRAGRGPGIELLEYLAPRDGRPLSPDTRPNDLVHWQTRLVAGDGAAARALDRAHVVFISPGAVALPGRELGFGRAVAFRDPDGHGLEVTLP